MQKKRAKLLLLLPVTSLALHACSSSMISQRQLPFGDAFDRFGLGNASCPPMLSEDTVPASPRPNRLDGLVQVDLWERIRSGFRFAPSVHNDEIERQIRWYAADPESLSAVQRRARPYLHFIVNEIQRRRLPYELALLPIVESAFRPHAESPDRASGIWQFMPSTGRQYGLDEDWWYDGRRDVVASTHAALDYLQRLARTFDGDWSLTLAAYNAGPAKVQRAIAENEERGLPTDFWSLDLPGETRLYVPRLYAIAQLVQRPAAYGATLEQIPNRPYFARVDAGAQIDLALAAELAGVTVDELFWLNPGFKRWATSPGGPHLINLPADRAQAFRHRLAGITPEQRMRWKRYTVRSGDNLGSIALKYGTTVSELQEANDLKGTRIRAGLILRIPLSTRPLDQQARLDTTPRFS